MIAKTKVKLKTKTMKVKIEEMKEEKLQPQTPNISPRQNGPHPNKTGHASSCYSNPDPGPRCRKPTPTYSIFTANVVRYGEKKPNINAKDTKDA